MYKLGLKINQQVTRPPAASETRWAGILPQIAWVNEHHDVLLQYERKPAKGCVQNDDGTTFENHIFDEYDWIIVADLDAAVRPCGPFISTMEATERVTISLVIPMTLAIIHVTSTSVPVQRYTFTNGELVNDDMVDGDSLSVEVQEVRDILHNENKRRFFEGERLGHREDLLICTILDPRFKLMNFHGCTSGMKDDAECYLRSAYKSDWSPAAVMKAQHTVKVNKGKDVKGKDVEVHIENGGQVEEDEEEQQDEEGEEEEEVEEVSQPQSSSTDVAPVFRSLPSKPKVLPYFITHFILTHQASVDASLMTLVPRSAMVTSAAL